MRDPSGAPVGYATVSPNLEHVKRAEAALRDSEERFRSLVEPWAQAVWETAPDGVVVKDSPSWRAYTGQTLEQCLGWGWLDAIHPDDRAFAAREWRDAVAARRPLDTEFRLRHVEGDWRWTNVRAAPLVASDGAIRSWVGMNVDITDRRRAAELADALLRLPEETPNSVLRIARDGTVLYANPAATSAALGRTGDCATPPPLAELVGRAFAAGRRIDADVEVGDAVFSTTVVPAEAEARVYAHDITKRRRAEEALREKGRKYRSLFESSIDAVYVTRHDGTILDANRAACRLHGMDVEEIRAKGREGVVESDERLAAALERRLTHGHARSELTFRRKDGTTCPVEVESVIVDPSGPEYTAFVIARDITARKCAEEALREALAAAERNAAELARSSGWIASSQPDPMHSSRVIVA